MTDWNAMDDEDFRSEVHRYFEQSYPSALRYPTHRLRWGEIKDWYLALSKKGWLAPTWPVEFGGMGLSPTKLLIFLEEQEQWGVARTPDMGMTMVGPLLIKHGTDEQKAYYLPKILKGEHIWCQGYSEPNAGSDLASLTTSAVFDGDHFVVNGQKTWTTLAQDATHIFLLARTDPQARKKQEGISFLLIDCASPGMTVRPIRNLAGQEEFCEVFFDNVRVPKENIVGEINKGWPIAKAMLGFERITLGSPKQSQYALGRLELMARQQGLLGDPVFLDKFTKLQLDVADLASVYARFVDMVKRDETLGSDVSLLKIWATETYSRVADLMVEAAGPAGAMVGNIDFGLEFVDVLTNFYHARPAPIYGGTNEIQRNIIAKDVLRLPT